MENQFLWRRISIEKFHSTNYIPEYEIPFVHSNNHLALNGTVFAWTMWLTVAAVAFTNLVEESHENSRV